MTRRSACFTSSGLLLFGTSMPSPETLESLRLRACVSRAGRVNHVRRIIPQDFLSAVSRLLMVFGCFVAFTATQPAAYAQERTTLRRVEIVGLQRLLPDQVIASSGLRVGDLVDAPMIDTAAAKLM